MRDTTIARSYAEALFALGEKHDEQEAYAAAFTMLRGVLEDVPRVREFLASPKITAADKKRALERALAGKAPRHFVNFTRVLVDKRRQRLLAAIGREFESILDDRLGRVHVQVTLAREPDEAQRRRLSERLTRTLRKTAVTHIRVNPHILGGVILRYDDYVLDGSLRRRLLSLRRRLTAVELHS